MNKWIEASRPRTLPLALSSIFMGSFLAIWKGKFDVTIFILCCLTTVFLQVFSNFANDYGDTQNGADSEKRIGPKRSVQKGEVSQKKMLTAIIITGIISFILGISLIFIAFNGIGNNFYWFLGLGILSIAAAYTYTAGSKPYGYAGLGDISVFLFFGLLGVCGSYFLYANEFELLILSPAIACGALATGVLNLNNIRDIESDKETGKITIPVRIGRKNAIIYHWILLSISLLSVFIFAYSINIQKPYFLLAVPIIILNGVQLNKIKNPDPLLKKLALSTLAFVILLGLSII